MKKILVFLIASFITKSSYSQQIVNNKFYNSIDENCNIVDTGIAKCKFTSVNLYGCEGSNKNKDSCILFKQEKYDKNGRLLEYFIGDNLDSGWVDYRVRYNKLSDSLFESIVLYPERSPVIPDDFFIDTVINKHNQKKCLYKQDKHKNFYMRSIYSFDKDGNMYQIKRYDIDGKLISIYYPLGSRIPKMETKDTLLTDFNRIISSHTMYEENDYKVVNTYDKHERLLECEAWNFSYKRGIMNRTKEIYAYDDAGHILIKIILGASNQLSSEERFEYKNNYLTRHTVDSDITDGILNEETLYENGRLIQKKSHEPYLPNETMWKCKYDERGIKVSDEYYINGMLKSNRLYDYE